MLGTQAPQRSKPSVRIDQPVESAFAWAPGGRTAGAELSLEEGEVLMCIRPHQDARSDNGNQDGRQRRPQWPTERRLDEEQSTATENHKRKFRIGIDRCGGEQSNDHRSPSETSG